MSATPVIPGLLYLVHDHRKLHSEMISATTGADAIAKCLREGAR